MIRSAHKNAISRLLSLILSVVILLSTLTSCGIFSYVADSKAEIQTNLDTAEDQSYEYVWEYLRDWGMPLFDRIKFQYLEEIFIQLYNYEGGMPDTFTHAKDTAKLFLDEEYDDIKTDDKTAVTDALLVCYVTALDDPYSAYRPPMETDSFMTDMSGKFGGIGVMVEYDDANQRIIINTVYPDSPAEKAGIKVGDIIHAVDGVTVTELGYTNAVNYVRGEIGTDVELTMLRGEEYITLTATRAEVEELNVVYEVIELTDLGYVQIVSFKENTFDQFKAAIDDLESKNVKGIIFDLRNNLGGYVDSVMSIISYLIPDGQPVISYQYKGFDKTELVSEDEGEDHVVDLPFVVICNELTASAGEIFTAAMRDYREWGLLDATIVGTTTFKKGIMQNTYYYPLDKSTVTMTVAYYDPPCGVNYHGIGITPDVYVEIDENDTADVQYLTAIEELVKLINDN